MATSDGDERARRWAALLVHREQLLRVARSRTASREDAEDCVQEALARAVEFTDLDLDRAGAFLNATTIRLTVDLHRARTRQARLALRVGQQATPADDHAEDVADVSLARWLAEEARRLSDQERAVLQARMEGGTSRDAAAALGISVRAAESSFTRVRSKLVTAWAKVAVVVGALWLAARRHALVSVPVTTAVAASVALGPVTLLPSTTPAPPVSAAPRAAAPAAPVVVPPSHTAAPVVVAPEATRAPASATAVAPEQEPVATPAPARGWHHDHGDDRRPDCEPECEPGPLVAVLQLTFPWLFAADSAADPQPTATPTAPATP